MANKTPLNRKFSYLREYTNEMPRFVTEYIIEYYNGESINTQIGYAIDIRVFLNYIKLTAFPELNALIISNNASTNCSLCSGVELFIQSLKVASKNFDDI